MLLPISLPPTCGKGYERLLWTFNDLIYPFQSDFKLNDSFINQLLSITHEIYHSIGEDYEIRGASHDILKAFDKVWNESLVFKLK